MSKSWRILLGETQIMPNGSIMLRTGGRYLITRLKKKRNSGRRFLRFGISLGNIVRCGPQQGIIARKSILTL